MGHISCTSGSLWVPIIRSWALTRGFALHPGTRNRYEIRYTRTQHRPAPRQVKDHGRVSGTHRSSRDTDSATAPRVAHARAAADAATGFRSVSQSGCPPLGSAPTVISSHTRSGIVHTAAHATGHAPGDAAANSVTPAPAHHPDAGRCRPPQSPTGVATDTYIDRMSPTSDFPEAVTQDQRLSDFLADDQGAWTTVGDLHRWMQVIGHDGRCTHSIRSGGGSQVWHSDSASMNERASR